LRDVRVFGDAIMRFHASVLELYYTILYGNWKSYDGWSIIIQLAVIGSRLRQELEPVQAVLARYEENRSYMCRYFSFLNSSDQRAKHRKL